MDSQSISSHPRLKFVFQRLSIRSLLSMTIGISVLVFILGLGGIYYWKINKAKNTANIATSLTQKLIPTVFNSNEKIYIDPKGKFKISLPDGWEIFHTEYWTAFRLAGSPEFVGENISFDYVSNFRNWFSESTMNSSLINLISDYNNKLYSDGSIQKTYGNQGKLPVLSTITKGKYLGVLEECRNVTVKGGGYLCTSKGEYFLKQLYVERDNGDVLKLTINSNSENMRNVNLTDWVTNIEFVGN